MKRILSVLIPVAIALTGCKGEPGGNFPDSEIKISTVLDKLSSKAQVTILSRSIRVDCIKGSGNPDFITEWTLTSGEEWLTLSFDESGLGASTSISGVGSKNVYIVVQANTNTIDRSADIFLNGSTEPALVIVQSAKSLLPELPPPGSGIMSDVPYFGELPTPNHSYVGAFWRADQIGERVIRTAVGANAGEWSAEVAWYSELWDIEEGDGVVLATGDSADPGIRGADPGDAEEYKVTGTESRITGTVQADEYIVFRIGLTAPFAEFNTETNPARYAVVLLTYADGTKKQKIFLRQGEGADYVMRPGDKDGGGADVGDTDNRTYAVKFSPFNITASDDEWAAATPGGPDMTDYPQLAVRGGVFTEYPSQGGAIFQGEGKTDPEKRRAYNHQANVLPSGMQTTNGMFNDEGTRLWNAATNETCPEGWRRPNDGSSVILNPGTDGANGSVSVKGSEMRQSLHLNPLTTNDVSSPVVNSVYGYLADGFFDRRATETTANGDDNAKFGSVGLSDIHAGFRGRLFFNPTSYNSLFLPCNGYRNATQTVALIGLRAYYWTGTAFGSTNTPMGCFFVGDSQQGLPYSQSRSMSFSVRCVKE